MLLRGLLVLNLIILAAAADRKLGERCNKFSPPCGTENSECRRYMCRCKTGFVKKDGECIAQSSLQLGARCTGISLPCAAHNSICLAYRCKCNKGFVQKGQECRDQTELHLGEMCTGISLPCAEEHSQCRGYRCRCKAGFVKKGDGCTEYNIKIKSPTLPTTPTTLVTTLKHLPTTTPVAMEVPATPLTTVTPLPTTTPVTKAVSTIPLTLPALPTNDLFIDVNEKYGISGYGIFKSLQEAKGHFADSPNSKVTLYFSEGTHTIYQTGPGINMYGIVPGPSGRLILTGAGMNLTTLVFSNLFYDAVRGRTVSRITFKDMHITRGMPIVTQGHVYNVSKGEVVLTIPYGFPTPEDIFNRNFHKGRYLRRYTDETDPKLIVADNRQVPWSHTTQLKDNVWIMHLKNRRQTPNYNIGDLIGVKSKCCGRGGGNTFWFCGGNDIVFESVKWTRQSRGTLRCGINNIRFSNCRVEKEAPVDGQGWCLATSGGGPQIGQLYDRAISNVTVENFYAEGTGDDAIALFNVKENADISNCFIKDSFARGIFLYNSEEATALRNNTLQRCVVHAVTSQKN